MSLRLPGESMLSRSAYAAPTKSPYEVDGAKTWLWHGAFFFLNGDDKDETNKMTKKFIWLYIFDI
jgi:hypothetical protein